MKLIVIVIAYLAEQHLDHLVHDEDFQLHPAQSR